jgi:hypothetical protein
VDLGQILAGAGRATQASPPGTPSPNIVTPLVRPSPTPWASYQNAILAQSRLPTQQPQNPRSFPVPAPFRPNQTKANGITTTPAVTPLPGPANAAKVAQPGKPTVGIPTSPASRAGTPFSDYRGTTMGSESGHLASVKGFTS